MPGYSHYDRVCDFRISDALIAVLQQPSEPRRSPTVHA
jgi:hypothetical protein